MDTKLTDRTALVTGGGTGIGAAIAQGMAAEGANVVVNYSRSEQEANDTVAQIKSAGGRAIAIRCDVTQSDQIRSMFDQARAEFGRVDILVNNAGIAANKRALECSLEEWERVIRVNLTGAFLCSQAAGKEMVKQGYGKIINICSLSGQRGGIGRAPYGAAKAGLELLTKVMAVGWAPHGVTVNAIGPGPTSTPGMLAADSRTPDEVEADLEAHLPLGRRMEPEEMVGAVIYLTSKSSAGTTGHLLLVDGGWKIRGL